MMDNPTNTLVSSQSGELAFKLYEFESIRHFNQIQRFNYYSLVWIKKGSGTAQADTREFSYSENQIYTFSLYQPFMFNSTSETSGVVINFHPDFLCIYKHQTEIGCDGVLFNNIYQTPSLNVAPEEAEKLNWIVSEIKRDLIQDKLATSLAIESYLKLFLINCSRIKKEQNPEVNFEKSADDKFIVQKLKDYIETNYRLLHSPKQYADLLNISPNALAKIVKSHFNKTLSEIIAERIIIEAKRELYLTEKSVEVIAYELGYKDPFYFSRFFKKHTDVSPSHYRSTLVFKKYLSSS